MSARAYAKAGGKSCVGWGCFLARCSSVTSATRRHPHNTPSACRSPSNLGHNRPLFDRLDGRADHHDPRKSSDQACLGRRVFPPICQPANPSYIMSEFPLDFWLAPFFVLWTWLRSCVATTRLCFAREIESLVVESTLTWGRAGRLDLDRWAAPFLATQSPSERLRSVLACVWVQRRSAIRLHQLWPHRQLIGRFVTPHTDSGLPWRRGVASARPRPRPRRDGQAVEVPR